MAIAWVTPTFSAGNFTVPAGGAWTVDAGDVTTFRYRRVGKTITVAFTLVTTSVSATAGPSFDPKVLQIAIPQGLLAKRRTSARISLSNAGTPGLGYCTVTAGGSVIQCYIDSEGQWLGALNTTSVAGEITFEVQ